ncbi:hypothetical protein V6N13_137237 [Hibiscus sabdariffa]
MTENPSLPKNPNVGEVLADSDNMGGHQRGRPPEEMVDVDMVDALERSGPEIPIGIQPTQKKGRTGGAASMVVDASMESVEGTSPGKAGATPDAGGGMEIRPVNGLSFKDKLLGNVGRSRTGPCLGCT